MVEDLAMSKRWDAGVSYRLKTTPSDHQCWYRLPAHRIVCASDHRAFLLTRTLPCHKSGMKCKREMRTEDISTLAAAVLGAASKAPWEGIPMVLPVLALLVLGLMCGSELNVALFAHPILNRHPLEAHILVR